MPEVMEEQRDEQFGIGRLVGIVRRRHMHFLIPLLLGWFLVWIVSWVLPPRYKSGTLILVQQPTMPQNYVVPNVSNDMQARLQSITQQILSRTRLLLIINKLRLYDDGKKAMTDDQKVITMRKDIEIELVRNQQKDDITAFRIFFSAKDPQLAQKVTGALTNLFITENLRVREAESEGTTSFIEQQLQDAQVSLSAQEEQVRRFEAQHMGDLPSQQASNLQILAGLQAQLQSEQDALNTAKQQRVYLQAMIEQERAAQPRERVAVGASTSAEPPTDVATIDQQLDKLQAQLAELRTRYTDRYPDVQRLKLQIASLQSDRNRLIASQRLQKPGAITAPTTENNSVLSAGLRQLQGQFQANQLEIRNREESVASLQNRIGQYQARLNAVPMTQQQLADLTRGYDQSKENYDELLKKRDQSKMATSMEQLQQGERFIMLDPPSLPTMPDFPNRRKFSGIGLALGLVLGFAVAGAFEFMDDRLHSEKDIRSMLPIPVIAEVPAIGSVADQRAAQKRLALGWTTSAVVVVTIIAGSVFSYLHN